MARPEQRLGFSCSRDRRRIVAGVETRLQLADPIAAGGISQTGTALQMLLEPALVEFIEGVISASARGASG